MKFLSTLAATAFLAVGLSSAQAADKIKIGTLTCFTDASIGLVVGSQKSADCAFRATDGREDLYTADISRIGLDLGITAGQTIVWVVFAAGSDAADLSGTYLGASAEASVIGGLNANALYGGFKKSYALQPFSGGAQTGINVALTATALTLTSVSQ